MKKWRDLKNNISSLNVEEKKQISETANLVGEIIQRRQNLGLTQRQLAELSGVKQSAIARLESNGVIPRVDTLFKLLRPLGLRVILVNDEES